MEKRGWFRGLGGFHDHENEWVDDSRVHELAVHHELARCQLASQLCGSRLANRVKGKGQRMSMSDMNGKIIFGAVYARTEYLPLAGE